MDFCRPLSYRWLLCCLCSGSHGLVLGSTDRCSVFFECGVGERRECRDGGSDFTSEIIELYESCTFCEFPEDAVVGASSVGAANGATDQLCKAAVVDDDAFTFDKRAGWQHVSCVLEHRGSQEILNDDGFDIAEGFGLEF